MSRSVVVIHAAVAAIAPVNKHLAAHAPDVQVTNLLDDGLLRMFAAKDYAAAEAQLLKLIGMGHAVYGAGSILITCSAVPKDSMTRIRADAPVPVTKIDEPMARAALALGGRIGILCTFPPTLEPTTSLLAGADLHPVLVSPATDEAILTAAESLAPNVDAIVLAQISMSHLTDTIQSRTGRPTLSALTTLTTP